MAITEALRLVVHADVQGAVKGIESLGKTADRELSKSEKTAQRWGNHLTKAGAGMIAFGSVAIAGLASAATAASDLGEVMSKNTVVFDDSAKKVETFAEGAAKIGQSKRAALEAATGFGNLFTSMGLAADKSADMSIELTTLASDLASFSNTSPEEAIEALTSALIGEAEPIRKYGVLLDDATLKAKALEMGLISTTTGTLPPAIRAQAAYAAILEQTTNAQGDFQRTSGSAANQQRVLAANFENLKASIGQGALPAMTSLLNVANDVIGGFQSMNAVTDGTLGKIATFGAVGLVAAGGISTVIGQVLKMGETFSTAASGVAKMTTRLGGLRTVLVGAGIAAAIVGIGVAVNAMREQANAKEIDNVTEAFVAMGTKIDDSFKDTIRTLESAGELDAVFDRLRNSNQAAAERFIDTAEAAGVSADAIDDMRKSLEQKREADQQGKVDQEANTEAVNEGAEAMGGAAEATEEAKSALEEYNEELKASIDPWFAAMDAIKGNRDAQLAYRDAQTEVLTAQHDLDEAIRKHGRDSDEAREATRALEDAQRGLTDAEWGTVESAAEVDSALASLKDAVERGDVSVDDFRSTLVQWVRQGFLTMDQANKAATSVGGLAIEAENADRKRVSIPVTAPGSKEARIHLASVRDTAHSIPGRRHTATTTSGTTQARNNLAAVRDTALSIPNSISIGVHVGGDVGQALAALAGRRALGGPVYGNRLYEVAENSQHELFESQGHRYLLPGADGHVIPMTHLGPSGSMGGGGGSMYVDQRQITIHTGADPQGVVEALKRYERSNGPVPITVRT